LSEIRRFELATESPSGIETDRQLQELRLEFCERGQGFLLAGPLDPEAATRFLAAADRRRAIAGHGDRRLVEPGA